MANGYVFKDDTYLDNRFEIGVIDKRKWKGLKKKKLDSMKLLLKILIVWLNKVYLSKSVGFSWDSLALRLL